MEYIKREFILGGHKAAAMAMLLERARDMLVSSLAPGFVKSVFLEPYPTVGEALKAAKNALGEDASVVIMPYGASTLPSAD